MFGEREHTQCLERESTHTQYFEREEGKRESTHTHTPYILQRERAHTHTIFTEARAREHTHTPTIYFTESAHTHTRTIFRERAPAHTHTPYILQRERAHAHTHTIYFTERARAPYILQGGDNAQNIPMRTCTPQSLIANTACNVRAPHLLQSLLRFLCSCAEAKHMQMSGHGLTSCAAIDDSHKVEYVHRQYSLQKTLHRNCNLCNER